MIFFDSVLFLRLVASFIASAAFAIVFRTAPRHLPYAAISGAITYFVYHLVLFLDPAAVFLAAFLSTVSGAIFAEIYARIRRAPAIIILTAAVIPTVPGSSLYRWVQNLLLSDNDSAMKYLGETIAVGLGIACGIVAVSISFRAVSSYILRKHGNRRSSMTKTDD